MYAGAAMRAVPTGPRRTPPFLAGCCLLRARAGHRHVDDQLLSGHMVQHLLLLDVAPLLLLGGAPGDARAAAAVRLAGGVWLARWLALARRSRARRSAWPCSAWS